MEDEQMIEALTPDTSQKAFTDGIGTRGVIGRCEYLDATRLGNPREGHSKLAIVITDEVLRTRAIGGCLPQLLRGPRVGGRARHADMDHSARVQFDDEEDEQRVEEEIGDRKKIAGPDLLGMSM